MPHICDLLTPQPRRGAQRGANIVTSAGTAARSQLRGPQNGLGRREEPHNIPAKGPAAARRPRTAARAATWRRSPQHCGGLGGLQQPGGPQGGTKRGGNQNWREQPEGSDRVRT